MPDALFRAMPADKRFVDLPDGRILFLPKGPGGRAYVVRDEATRERLTRRYTVVDHVMRGAVGLFAIALALRHWTLAVLAFAIAFAVPRWMDRVTTESLLEARDPDALRAAARREPSRFGWTLVGVVGSLVWLASLLYQFQSSGELTAELVLSLVAAVAVLVSGFQAWRDESADDLMGSGHTEQKNVPIKPKYF